jgi:hypothetical protein
MGTGGATLATRHGGAVAATRYPVMQSRFFRIYKKTQGSQTRLPPVLARLMLPVFSPAETASNLLSDYQRSAKLAWESFSG